MQITDNTILITGGGHDLKRQFCNFEDIDCCKSVRIVETSSRDRVDSSGIGEKRPLPGEGRVRF
jgi:hypothetical protein